MNKSWGSIYFGILILLLGIGLLAQNAGLIQIGDVLSTWWPTYVFVAMGVFTILGHKGKGGLVFGGFLVILGVVWQLEQLGLLRGNVMGIIWAIGLIMIGGSILYRSLFPPKPFEGFGGPTDTFFGEMDHDYSGKEYAHSDTNTMFGQTKIDLREAKFASKRVTLNTTTMFGETIIYLPVTVQVEKKLDVILGDIEEHNRKPSNPETTLIISGSVIFGNVRLQN